MFFKTREESRELVDLAWSARSREEGNATAPNPLSVRIVFEERRHASYELAKQVSSWLGNVSWCLLWITEYGIWPNSENLHIYYRLRASYGDFRELHAAPGHMMLGHESTELITWLDLALRFGWGGHLVSSHSWVEVW